MQLTTLTNSFRTQSDDTFWSSFDEILVLKNIHKNIFMFFGYLTMELILQAKISEQRNAHCHHISFLLNLRL